MKKVIDGFLNGFGILLCFLGLLLMLGGAGFSAFFFILFALSLITIRRTLVTSVGS